MGNGLGNKNAGRAESEGFHLPSLAYSGWCGELRGDLMAGNCRPELHRRQTKLTSLGLVLVLAE